MRTTPFFPFLLELLAVLSLLTACSLLGQAPPTAVPEAPPTPTPTLAPTDTPTAVPYLTAIPAEAVEWVRVNAVSFKSAEPGQGCADLRHLLDMIGEARVVALGEATHGTHEFEAMKQRIVECLATEKGFTVIAMEADWGESRRIDDYVQGGTDELPMLYENPGYWMWNTDEVMGLVDWMGEYNASSDPAEALHFFGLDMQSVTVTADYLLAYIDSVDPEGVSAVRQDLSCFRNYIPHPYYYQNASAETYERCRQGLQAAYDGILSNQEGYEAASSPAAFANGLHTARLLIQNEQLFSSGMMMSNYRDAFMAENAAWLLDQAGPEAKMVIWAHNYHVSTFVQVPSEDESSANQLTLDFTYPLMGVYLRERYGSDFVSVGFDFGSGSFNAYPLIGDGEFRIRTFEAASFLPNSYEELLSLAGLPQYYLDLRSVPDTGPAGMWFSQPGQFRNISGYYDAGQSGKAYLLAMVPDIFDILIYFDETSPTVVR